MDRQKPTHIVTPHSKCDNQTQFDVHNVTHPHSVTLIMTHKHSVTPTAKHSVTPSGQVWGYTPEQRVAGSTLQRYSFGLRLAIAQADARPAMPVSLR